MDSLLCPWEKKTITFSLNSTRLIYGHPINMDTFYGSLSVLINRVLLYLGYQKKRI